MVVGSSLTLNYHFGRNGLAYPHNKFNKQSKKDTRTDVLFTCERMTKSSVRVLVGKFEFINLIYLHKSQLANIITPPIKKDKMLTQWPKYCLMMIATKLNKPIPNTKPPAKPSITHRLSVPTNTQNRIAGNSNAVMPSMTKKTYPMGWFVLNSSSDEAWKYFI